MAIKETLQRLNFFAECRKYRIGPWSCPPFLFMMMGSVIIFAMLGTFVLAKRYIEEPEVVALFVIIITVILLFIDYAILSGVRQISEANILKSEFVNLVSHQLRAPLSSLRWSLSLLLKERIGKFEPKQIEFLQIIQDSSTRMIKLVNDLLDVSRIESGKMRPEPTPTNLVEFITSMLVDLKAQFAKRSQEFVFEHPEALPRIPVDPKLIWQILQNLLSNASKYTPEKGKITLALSLEPENILVKVADNGLGIPEFQKHRLFEKFFRADNVNKSDGTGLGLYISRKIVETSGGKLWFESTEGKGSTFYFTIPVAGNKNAKVE